MLYLATELVVDKHDKTDQHSVCRSLEESSC